MLIIVLSYVHNLFILFSTLEVFLAKRGLFRIKPHTYEKSSPLFLFLSPTSVPFFKVLVPFFDVPVPFFAKLSQFITKQSLFSPYHHNVTRYIPNKDLKSLFATPEYKAVILAWLIEGNYLRQCIP